MRSIAITCGRTLDSYDCADGTPQGVNILALHLEYLETMSFEGLGQLVALEVLGRVTSDSDIVII